jgi:hypothetical protein
MRSLQVGDQGLVLIFKTRGEAFEVRSPDGLITNFKMI